MNGMKMGKSVGIMSFRIHLLFCVIAAIFIHAVIVHDCLAREKAAPTTILEFPTYPVGKIFVLPNWRPTSKRNDGEVIAPARGKVVVPADAFLSLHLDYYLISHPEALKVPAGNIVQVDCDKMAFENSICGPISHIPSVLRVEVSSTEVDDVGIEQIAKIKNLEALLADKTIINGSCIKSLSAAKNLRLLDLSGNNIKPANYKGLSELTQVTNLKLIGNNITDECLKPVGSMISIEELQLKRNPKLTSAAMKYLTNLKHLRLIDIQETGIGAEGVETLLKNVSARVVSINDNLITPPQRDRLRKMFPKTSIVFSMKKDKAEIDTLFAPLK